MIPKDFLWGASTSAFQVEGAYNEDGKGLSVKDIKDNLLPGNTDFKTATDHYHHYKEDVKLMAEMGFKSYRFSISWARIMPDGKHINLKGIEFYHNLIDELLKYNIEPIVTIYHYEMPIWLEKQGGWSNREVSVNAYCDYASVLFNEYGKKVKYWLTINEQNILTLMIGHTFALPKENQTDYFKDLYQKNHNMFIAQALTYKLHKTLKLKSLIGPVPGAGQVYPNSNKPKDIDAAYKANSLINWLYFDMAVYGTYNKVVWNWLVKNNYQPEILDGDLEILKENTATWLGFNYYYTQNVKAATKHGQIKMADIDLINEKTYDMPDMYDLVKNPNITYSKFGWGFDALGFLATCRELNDRYHLPIIICENGYGDYDKLESDGSIHDTERIKYWKDHIKLIPQILSEGINLIGFNPWSAIDLVSTHEGVKKRYGLVYVNIDDEGHGDYKRYKKDSFYWYQKVIKSNGEDLD